MLPLIVNVSMAAVIHELVPRTISPAQVLPMAVLLKAPKESPVPLRLVIGSLTVMPPPTSSRAPSAMEVPPAVVPSALAFEMATMPSLIAVAPV